MKTTVTDPIAARKLALTAGKQHRAGIQKRLKAREKVRAGSTPDLKKGLTSFCRKEKIAKEDAEPILRLIDLVTSGGSHRTLSEIALEVRAIYQTLCRSKSVHPMLLAFAGIADDSVSHAARTAASGAPTPKTPSGAVPFASTVIGADLTGFYDGFMGSIKYLPVSTSIKTGVHWASHDSSLAEYHGLPWI